MRFQVVHKSTILDDFEGYCSILDHPLCYYESIPVCSRVPRNARNK